MKGQQWETVDPFKDYTLMINIGDEMINKFSHPLSIFFVGVLKWRHMSVKASQITDNYTVNSTANKENINAPHYWPSWGNPPPPGEFPSQKNITNSVSMTYVIIVTTICNEMLAKFCRKIMLLSSRCK